MVDEPITGELRDLLADINWTEIIDHMQTSAGAIVDGDWLDAWHEAASNACDAIDAVHGNLERENDRLRQKRDMRDAMAEEAYNRGYDEGFASADDWLGQHEDAMAEHGWVRGPLDADGKMWRSGDMSDSNWGVIEGIAYGNGRWLVRGHDTSAPWIPADSIRHHHAPTVEDVLREMFYRAHIYDEREMELLPDLIADFAAKLQLRGDAE